MTDPVGDAVYKAALNVLRRHVAQTVSGSEEQCRDEQRRGRKHQHVRLGAAEIRAEQAADADHAQEGAPFARQAREGHPETLQAPKHAAVSVAIPLRGSGGDQNVVESGELGVQSGTRTLATTELSTPSTPRPP